eukprot:CAMPEP_0175124676 /NCGR_PEP_ID=MMETSP0087-20121206/2907_1 /TAXON_ID=136419 /ORGANISM="Unknown Unknown, Strain D1" /LENGTH=130 /DNA_ID=CAMNT_0016406457 /DNA_START=434 /DNA_END=827 /DNA_ORIENTATION=-
MTLGSASTLASVVSRKTTTECAFQSTITASSVRLVAAAFLGTAIPKLAFVQTTQHTKRQAGSLPAWPSWSPFLGALAFAFFSGSALADPRPPKGDQDRETDVDDELGGLKGQNNEIRRQKNTAWLHIIQS